MSFVSKRKADYVAAPAQMCSRCHERMGEIEVQTVLDVQRPRTVWFCRKCADVLGRSRVTDS